MAKKLTTIENDSIQEEPEVQNTVRKRTRISKKEDHVYQANSEGQGERFDSEEQKLAAKNASPAIFAVDTAKLVPPRKNRGRPSKAYLQALEEYNRQLSLLNELKNDSEQAETLPEETEETSPIAKPSPEPEVSPTVEETPRGIMIPVANDLIILRDIPSLEEDIKKIYEYLPDDKSLKFSKEPNEEFPTTLDRNDTQSTAIGKLEPSNIDTIAFGVLELEKDNSGYLRSSDYNYLPSPDDILISNIMVRQYGLRTGDVVEGIIRMPRGNERSYVMCQITKINGLEPRKVRDRVPFENLTPLFPDEKFTICGGDGRDSMSCRIVDLFSPIGKGQRALIVAQPKTGKTLLMKDVANAIAHNHPGAHLIMLLIDERPEEVTDMARTVNAEVIASTFDEPASQHVRIANIVLEKAKRMVECGHDVVIFLDSITRLARAYNTVAPGSGKILTGGVDANALQKPKRFFGAARNIENGGSLTIIATALIETGSKMDEVIFEEFKGTGNMELQLERALANKRIFPAVNLTASSTRRDDLLLDEMTQNRMWVLRNYIADMNPIEAMKFLRQRLDNTKDNHEFVVSINS